MPRDGVALHPHPVPPLALTAASSAQHALTPAGAGPPQQPVGAVFCGSSGLFVCLVFMVISSPELAARHLHRRRPSAMDASVFVVTVRPFDRWPDFTCRDRCNEEEFDDSRSGERKGKDGGS